jgi:CubicO group peptidase (beta-lactamase class C family)
MNLEKVLSLHMFHSNRLSLFVLALFFISIASISCVAAPEWIDLADDLESFRTDYNLPALSAAVILDGKLHAAGVVGVRKYGEAVKAEINDPFHIGSCTKAMTGSLVCLLVQQGKLKWDTTLAEFFPDLKESMHPDFRDVTLVHLLSHQAGMYAFTRDKGPLTGTQIEEIYSLKSPRLQRRKGAEILLTYPPLHKPGSKFLYSNIGFSLVGAITEEVMDEEWEHLIKRLLFDPLGMKTAGQGAMGTPDKIDVPWQHRIKSDQIIPVNPGPHSDNPPVLGPGGRVHCSILDWSKYIQCFLKAYRSEPGLIDGKHLQHLRELPFGGTYALGWSTYERSWGEGKVFSHGGSNTMNYAVAWIAPKKNFAVITATNIMGDKTPEGCDKVCAFMIKKFLTN